MGKKPCVQTKDAIIKGRVRFGAADSALDISAPDISAPELFFIDSFFSSYVISVCSSLRSR